MLADLPSPARILDVSIIIPTLNAARQLPATLAALNGVREIVVVDGGSRDLTTEIVRQPGVRIIETEPGRGIQLRAGASVAEGPWLLFLHADSVLCGDWRRDVENFIGEPTNKTKAGTFRFALDDSTSNARRLETWVAWRSRVLGLPYGDQGLLIHRDFYHALGGFLPWPLMEDVDLVRKIGRTRLTVFASAARTSAERWQREGWALRSLRNLTCLSLYFLGLPPKLLAKLYG